MAITRSSGADISKDPHETRMKYATHAVFCADLMAGSKSWDTPHRSVSDSCLGGFGDSGLGRRLRRLGGCWFSGGCAFLSGCLGTAPLALFYQGRALAQALAQIGKLGAA